MIKIMGKGFHLKFDNGLILSVQIGWGNYCENRDRIYFKCIYELYQSSMEKPIESKDCEIAIFNDEGEWLTNKVLETGTNDDYVKGYVGINELVDIINKCNNFKI